MTSDASEEPEGHLARYDGTHRRAGGVRDPGRDRGELAGVRRRDPDRPEHLLAASRQPARPRRSRSRARRRIARPRRACCFRRSSKAPSVASRSPRRTSCPTGRSAQGVSAHGQARRAHRRDRAGRRHRSAVGAAGQPPPVRPAARSGRADLRVRRRDDSRQDADRRRSVGGHRHHQHRQPIVRAQRRGQRRRPGRSGRGAVARGLRGRCRAQSRDRPRRAGAGGRCGRS